MRHFRQHVSRQQAVTVYNADYRVLTQVTWQEAIRLLLRGSVYVIERHSPAVHIHSPSTSSSCRRRWRCMSTFTCRIEQVIEPGVPGCWSGTTTPVPTAADAETPSTTSYLSRAAARTPG